MAGFALAANLALRILLLPMLRQKPGRLSQPIYVFRKPQDFGSRKVFPRVLCRSAQWFKQASPHQNGDIVFIEPQNFGSLSCIEPSGNENAGGKRE